jgi:hypothetical protein
MQAAGLKMAINNSMDALTMFLTQREGAKGISWRSSSFLFSNMSV